MFINNPKAVMGNYLKNLCVSVDQFFNALSGGDPDETISSRAAKAMMEGKKWGCVLCPALDYIDPGHCSKNIEYDEGKKVDPSSTNT